MAICEQLEDPKQAKGLVKRDVIRVVTPGTNLDAQALDESQEQLSDVYHLHLEDRYGRVCGRHFYRGDIL